MHPDAGAAFGLFHFLLVGIPYAWYDADSSQPTASKEEI